MITFKVDDLKEMSARLKALAEDLRTFGVAEEDIFASRLVSSELISNVIIHGGEGAELKCEIAGDKICISVLSPSFNGVNLTPPKPDVLAESGRGMYIVRSICLGEIERDDEGVKVFIKLH
ncbi:MAG: ATP-binding protein [Clostridia bacterium]|nr:ATP-binding protein [Clostridia bacterium]